MFHPRLTLRALLLPLAAGLSLIALPAQTATAASTLTNGGFETGGSGAATPAGWSEYGDTAASYTESGGRDGGHRRGTTAVRPPCGQGADSRTRCRSA